jgi:SNW domain-containing protein 1
MDREETRDVSEKIALGLLKGTGKLTGEALFDSRLFNQSSGMDAGFGEEDEYNTYSRPLFDRGEAGSIYRPKANEEDIYGDADAQIAKLSDTSRFRPDKGFQGAEGGAKHAPRDAPVQFEKAESHDPYARPSQQKSSRRDDSRDRDRGGNERDRERERDRYRDEEDDRRHRNKRSRYDDE